MKTSEDNIPKYLSTFELEEARLGQTMQALQLEMQNPGFLETVLKLIKSESANAEWALNEVIHQGPSDIKHELLKIVLKKISKK